MHAVVRFIGMPIGNENVAIVGHDDIGWRVETVFPVTRYARCAQGHQNSSVMTELDHLVPPRSLGGPGGGDCIGHPHVAVGVHIDAMRPYKHAAAKAFDDIAVQVEFDDRVQIRIETLVAETLRCTGVTSDHCPDVFAIRVHRYSADRTHLSPIRQFRPAIDGSVWVWKRLRYHRRRRAERNSNCQSYFQICRK
jgi:hypothetical protein